MHHLRCRALCTTCLLLCPPRAGCLAAEPGVEQLLRCSSSCPDPRAESPGRTMAGVSASTAAVFPSPVPSGIASPTAQAAGLRNKATEEGSVRPGSLCVPSVFGEIWSMMCLPVCFSLVIQIRASHCWETMSTEAKMKRRFATILLFFYVFIIMDRVVPSSSPLHTPCPFEGSQPLFIKTWNGPI